MICAQCGVGEVVATTRPGRRTTYRMIPDVEIPEHVAIPTCLHCGEEWVDESTAQAMDEAIIGAFETTLSAKAEEAVTLLKNARVAQRDLERLIGLSAGYLSKLRNGKTESRGPLVSLLMLLATDSDLVDRLRKLWSTHVILAQFQVKPPRPVATSMSVFRAIRPVEYAVSSIFEGGSVAHAYANRRPAFDVELSEFTVSNSARRPSDTRRTGTCEVAA